MKLGITIEPVKGLAVNELFRLARLLEFDHIEFNKRMISHVNKGVKAKLGKITTTFHLPIFNRDHYDFSSSKKLYEREIHEIITFINTNKELLNISYALSHPPEDPQPSFEQMMRRLEAIEVPLILENITGQPDEEFMDFYFSAKERLGNRLAGHVVDGPHRYLTHGDNWLNIPEPLQKEIVYVHISDCTKKKDLHRPLGCAKLPYNDFFDFLKEINYQGVILQEIMPNGFELDSIMDSNLHCALAFSKKRFIKLQLKYSVLRPIIRWRLKQAIKDLLEKGQSVLIQDVAYDYMVP
ncbi:MAG: hypothetical protein GF308_13645 [Candidatus Heimdallarchaeota archaeon]|nr:hypothetical protein [Candidatus Heimdallarchaeota archaeon]